MAVIEVEERGDVAVITLNRPAKLNAISIEMLDLLFDAIEGIGRSDPVGAVVLTGQGRAFSTGGDISAMHDMDERQFADTISRYMRLSAAFRACPKPIVAAIHGYALAGGFELALMCDVRFAATGTQFGLPDTPLGLSPTSGMTYLLPRIVGLGRALYLALGAENIDAAEAERIGLVSRVVPEEEVVAEAVAFAHRVASYPRVGVGWTKRTFHEGLDLDFESATRLETQAEVDSFRSPETRKRFQAFVDRKRRPEA
ncbi:MAG TPA: enoyl-CoA hydratase/isomerase family protein [Candidatus Limnocylindrales bacterium]|nr:enoyl-CoA hydratase/isomerase family protein [Candidatus Limnocylindrales bacterium]